jgi:flagellar protein FliO/FliZ
MDGNFIVQLLLLFIFLPLVITLIYITSRYGGKYMNKVSSGRIIKVVERVPLSQNSFLSVVIINNKPYVLSNGEKGAQILLELDEEAMESIRSYNANKNVNFGSLEHLIRNKIKGTIRNEKNQ